MGKTPLAALPVGELRRRISVAGALVRLYEKQANSGVKGNEVLHVQRELKVIKEEILSELLHARRLLQSMQKDLGAG